MGASKRNGHLTLAPKTSEIEVGTLVPQPHGGALLNGNPNLQAGPGVLSHAVRQVCLEKFQRHIPTLDAIADGTLKQKITVKGVEMEVEPELRDRIAAIEKLGKFGFGSEGATIAAAQLETPEGYKFSLILGDRDHSDE